MDRERLIQEIIENLARIQRPGLSAVWQKAGLSHAQLSMLYLLAYHSPISAKEIAEYLGITNSAVTQLVEPLVAKKLVNRQTNPRDRRTAHLRLSFKGRETLRKLARHKFAGLRTALESLDGNDLEQLHKLHKKMTENIS
ncbi:MAG TPA: MarR family transcriptional regulator [Candidatus Saccharimonadales bacterium]|jgi:DNA-binding MarR family transcriptional regulator|nr:MarR family transcriptional regulator [Candidatus Saccharimonadales bacterium]